MTTNNNHNSKRIASHLANVMRGMSADDSKAEFDAWLRKNPYSDEVIGRLTNDSEFGRSLDLFKNASTSTSRAKILKRIENHERRQRIRRVSSYCAVGIAAMLILMVSMLWNDPDNQIIEDNKQHEHPIVVLANGQQIDLVDKNKKSLLAGDFLAILNSTIDQSHCGTNQSREVTMNKLIVPKMQTYTIELADGTIVHLNCDSQLEFPCRFEGQTREVTIKGEGYFEVAKDKRRPFIVHYKDIAIEVYGTKFNVNTQTKNALEAVLFEGSIGIQTPNGKSMKMKPDEKAVVDMETKNTIIEAVDVSYYSAWRDNNFAFNAAQLSVVLEEINRWYGVTITAEHASDALVTGIFNRDTPLKEIVQSLETLTKVKLKINANDID